MQELRIKNMVCDRCILLVTGVLDNFGIAYKSVSLGRVILLYALTANEETRLGNALESLGFELLENPMERDIEAVKNTVIDLVTKQVDALKKFTISAFIHEKVGKDYKALSALFSAREGQTIEQFVIAQKIERVKEYLSYGEMSISEIADSLHYSSVAHLSNQFKKITGQTPSEFRKYGVRKALDKI